MTMKPCEDGEGVAMAKTSKDFTYPSMTQDEPERVEEVWRVGRDAYIDSLIAKISVSEKRAETLQHELAVGREKFLMHTAHVDAWLGTLADLFEARRENVAKTCEAILIEAARFKAICEKALAREIEALLKLATLERERDSSQASLLRVEEALKDARDHGLIYWEPNTSRGYVEKALMFERIRTALSPHTEK